MTRWSRRDFLRASGGCAALGTSSLVSSLLQMQLTRSAAAAAAPTDYRAMVCLFLHGGNDSFNMLVPTDADTYAAYRLARGNLALPTTGLHRVDDALTGDAYGLHPGMADVARLYRDGNLAFIANVGTLIEPTDKNSYNVGARLPLGLFSHSDQQQHWQTSVPQSRSQMTGWVGRMADVLDSGLESGTGFSMNIAIEQLNMLQTGRNVVPYVVGADGAEILAGYGASNGVDAILTRATDSLLAQTHSDLLKRTYARVRADAIDAAIEYNEATATVAIATPFPATTLGLSLRQVARAIGARGALGQHRQAFFICRRGWDHHDGVLTQQALMLPEVSQALRAFYNATVELGVADSVVTFTMSDFGRTLSTNGNGSDHAWGGNHIVMGGAVGGGRLYGEYPASLAPGSGLDVGRGRIIPTTSVDEYAAELAMWFGVANDGTLEDILPNVRNFYPRSAGRPPLGFVL